MAHSSVLPLKIYPTSLTVDAGYFFSRSVDWLCERTFVRIFVLIFEKLIFNFEKYVILVTLSFTCEQICVVCDRFRY